MAHNEVNNLHARDGAYVQVGPSTQTHNGNLIFQLQAAGASAQNESLRELLGMMNHPQISNLTPAEQEKIDRDRLELRKTLFLQSFYHLDHTKSLEDDKITHGTCEWFVAHESIRSWARQDSYTVLWVTGSPGMGKTTLAVRFCKEYPRLLPSLQPSRQVALYSLCDASENNTVGKILCVAIYQLLEHTLAEITAGGLDHIYYLAQGFLGPTATNVKRWDCSPESLWKFFCKLLEDAEFKIVYLVVDGLDECDEATQLDFIRLLKTGPSNLRVLLTSQPLENVGTFLRRPPQLSLRSKIKRFDLHDADSNMNEDIDRYIDEKVDEIADPEFGRGWTPAHRQRVTSFLKARKSSIFLPIVLVLEELDETPTDRLESVLEATDNTMEKLDELYGVLLQRLKSKVKKSQILLNMVCAFRPLSVSEMLQVCGYVDKRLTKSAKQDALADELEARRKSFLADLRLLGPMVRVRKSDDTVQFIHSSARNFLFRISSDPQSPFSNFIGDEIAGHRNLADHCLQAIIACAGEISRTMSGPHDSAVKRAQVLKSLLNHQSLLAYSHMYWYNHINRAYNAIDEEDRDLDRIGQSFFDLSELVEQDTNGRLVNFLSQPRFDRPVIGEPTDSKDDHPSQDWLRISSSDRNLDSLGFHARFGNTTLFKNYVRRKALLGLPTELGRRSTYSLVLAIRNAILHGDLSLFRCILETYPEIDLDSPRYSGIIEVASTSGNIEILRYIHSKHRADLQELEDALVMALHKDDYCAVEELLRHWDPRVTDSLGLNILHALATGRRSHAKPSQILKIWPYLKARGLTINAIDDMGNTVLHYLGYHIASTAGSTTSRDTFEGLIEEYGADPAIRNKAGALPVHLAARRVNFEAFEYLFSVTEQRLQQRRNDVTDIVVRSNHDTTAFNSKGNLTPLHWAMSRGSSDHGGEGLLVVRHLLSIGFRLDQESKSGRTPIHVAMENEATFSTLSAIATPLSGLDTLAMSTRSVLGSFYQGYITFQNGRTNTEVSRWFQATGVVSANGQATVTIDVQRTSFGRRSSNARPGRSRGGTRRLKLRRNNRNNHRVGNGSFEDDNDDGAGDEEMSDFEPDRIMPRMLNDDESQDQMMSSEDMLYNGTFRRPEDDDDIDDMEEEEEEEENNYRYRENWPSYEMETETAVSDEPDIISPLTRRNTSSLMDQSARRKDNDA